jgi:hypothetical protein
MLGEYIDVKAQNAIYYRIEHHNRIRSTSLSVISSFVRS